ncbi:formimidoylglutamate deiminase, partial [Rhizobium ruizarguesonis]
DAITTALFEEERRGKGAVAEIGFGSDSNVLISVPEELRKLEYSQSLALRARNVVAAPGGSTALSLFKHALAGGGAALKAPAGL